MFPQLRSLGRSPRALHFGLSGLADAIAYQAHPVLGPRLQQAAGLLLTHAGTDPVEILGAVDARKVRSSMTLFAVVPDAPDTYAHVLDRLYSGERCLVTLSELSP